MNDKMNGNDESSELDSEIFTVEDNPFALYDAPKMFEATLAIQAAVDDEIGRGRTREEIWQDMADSSSRLGQVLVRYQSVGAWDTASIESIDQYVIGKLPQA